MSVLTIILTVFLASAMAITSVRKALDTPDTTELRTLLQVSRPLWQFVGTAEAAAAAGLIAGLWLAPMGVAAAAGVAVVMAGALLMHLRRNITGVALAAPAFLLAVALATATLLAIR